MGNIAHSLTLFGWVNLYYGKFTYFSKNGEIPKSVPRPKFLKERANSGCNTNISAKMPLQFLQYEMGLESNVIRFVPKKRLYLLEYELAAILNRKPGPKFTPTRLKLRRAGIIQMGDLVQMAEFEFRQFTKNEQIIQEVRERLTAIGMSFGMATPGWKPRSEKWRREHR